MNNNEVEIAELKALRKRLSNHSDMNWIGNETYPKLLDNLECCIRRLESSEISALDHYLAVLKTDVIEFCDEIEDFWAQGA